MAISWLRVWCPSRLCFLSPFLDLDLKTSSSQQCKVPVLTVYASSFELPVLSRQLASSTVNWANWLTIATVTSSQPYLCNNKQVFKSQRVETEKLWDKAGKPENILSTKYVLNSSLRFDARAAQHFAGLEHRTLNGRCQGRGYCDQGPTKTAFDRRFLKTRARVVCSDLSTRK